MQETTNSQPILKPTDDQWVGLYVPKKIAELILKGIEDNFCPLFPDKNGVITPHAIYNASTGFILNAKDLIPAQIIRKNNGYESDVVCTWKTANRFKTQIKAKEKGLSYNFQTADGEYHHAMYFFAEQLQHPKKVLENAKINRQSKLKGEVFKINSVEDYLPSYLAACRSGAKVEVEKDVAEDFKRQFTLVCKNESNRNLRDKPDLNIQTLHQILFDADKKAVVLVQNREKELGLNQKPKYEKTFSMER